MGTTYYLYKLDKLEEFDLGKQVFGLSLVSKYGQGYGKPLTLSEIYPDKDDFILEYVHCIEEELWSVDLQQDPWPYAGKYQEQKSGPQKAIYQTV